MKNRNWKQLTTPWIPFLTQTQLKLVKWTSTVSISIEQQLLVGVLSFFTLCTGGSSSSTKKRNSFHTVYNTLSPYIQMEWFPSSRFTENQEVQKKMENYTKYYKCILFLPYYMQVDLQTDMGFCSTLESKSFLIFQCGLFEYFIRLSSKNFTD